LSWASGRRLASDVDDRALPERLLAHQRRNGFAFGLAGTAIAFYSTRSILWALPLLFSTLLISGYPLRRALFSETWPATRYLSFFHRLVIAVYGFWFVLASIPFLTRLAGTRDWIAGAVLAVVLIVWERHYAAFFLRLVRARPLEDGPLLERFRELARTAGMPEPDYLRVDLEGGSVANALALGSLRGNAVVFTDTLLARLEPDEAAAICGHELAHLNTSRRRVSGRCGPPRGA
jgi:Zn-dependent protease with chaperone function